MIGALDTKRPANPGPQTFFVGGHRNPVKSRDPVTATIRAASERYKKGDARGSHSCL
jgi:hypothetical protein